MRPKHQQQSAALATERRVTRGCSRGEFGARLGPGGPGRGALMYRHRWGVVMSTFSVEPEALRAAAEQLRGAMQAERAPEWPALPDFGEQVLQDAARAFARNVIPVWATRMEEFEEVVERLRASADAYEQADLDGVSR